MTFLVFCIAGLIAVIVLFTLGFKKHPHEIDFEIEPLPEHVHIDEARSIIIETIEKYGDEYRFGTYTGDKQYSATELIHEIKNDTDVGRQYIEDHMPSSK